MSDIISGPPLEPSFWQDMNKLLGDYILDYLKSADDRVYMIHGKTKDTLKLSELLLKSRNLAAHLQALGVKPNSYVGILMENKIEYMIVYLAIIFTGAIVTCFSNFYTVGELEHAVSLTKPSVLFFSQDTEEKARKLKKKFVEINHLIGLDQTIDPTDILLYSEFVNNNTKKLTTTRAQSNDTVAVLFSSGTTGYPKGVMLTHRNVVFTLEIIKKKNIFAFEGNFAIGILPMFHAYGMFINLFSITLGHTLIVLKKFEEELYLSLIQQYKPKFLYLVPPLIVIFIKSKIIQNYDVSSVKHIVCGAAPLKLEVENEIKKLMNLDRIQQGYGMTEASFGCTFRRKGRDIPASVGSLLPGIDAKVIDIHTKKVLGANEIGEICIRGPNIMKGYLKNPQETAKTLRDNWLNTGDIGYYESTGEFFIVDRKKELIKYNGFQVAPAEIEALLIKHPEVRDAGVIGIPDEIAGELPKAFIVKQSGSNITGQELQEYISSKLSSQKWLRGGITFIDEIPKNPSGKILRRELKKTANLVSKY